MRKEEVERMRWFWFVGIGVVLIVAVVSGFWLLGSLGEDPAVLISGFYDADGNPIGSGTSEAVVGGVEGVAFLKFSVNLRNTDKVSLEMVLVNASPSVLSVALPIGSVVSVPAGQVARWESELVDIRSFVGTTQVFSVGVEASSPLRRVARGVKSLSVVINEDPVAAFDFDVGSSVNNSASVPPAPPVVVCGNGILEGLEACDDGNVFSGDGCSNLCLVEPGNPPVNTVVRFRTSDLAYGSGAAVAFASSCGGVLKGFGKTSGVCTEFVCSQAPALQVPSSLGFTYLYVKDVDNVCVCMPDQVGSSSRPYRYNVADTDASKVSVVAGSVDASLEVACTV